MTQPHDAHGAHITVTLLFTDIEGSSRLWERAPASMNSALQRHDALLRTAIEDAGGAVFKTMGDSFHAWFHTPAAAVRAALSAQLALLRPGSIVTPVRMALYTGTVTQRDGDMLGNTVNRASRLLALAAGGDIVMSGTVARAVEAELPPDAYLENLGTHSLKQLAQPERLFRLRHPLLIVPASAHIEPEVRPNNLAARNSSVVGMADELDTVCRLIAAHHLVTITGFGGMGKTTIARAAAEIVLPNFSSGVWWADLTAVEDPELVSDAVRLAVGATAVPGLSPLAALLAWMETRDALIVIDNCEHLLDAVRDLLRQIQRGCPRVRLLATSRERLQVAGEHTHRLRCLAVPPEGEPVTVDLAVRYESVQLFLDRAAEAGVDLATDSATMGAVGQICRSVDGIPLAIELAAVRATVLSPREIADLLGKSLGLLRAPNAADGARHRTLETVLDWSFNLLDRPDQDGLMACSLFAGGWDLDAAAVVLGTGDSIAALDMLQRLVSKSLVTAASVPRASTRYRLLETVRSFCRHKLEATPAAPLIRERHAAHYVGLARRAVDQLNGPEQLYWLDLLAADHDNIRQAMLNSDAATRLDAARCMHRFWLVRGFHEQGAAQLRAALAAYSGDDVELIARSLNSLGILLWAFRDYSGAREVFQQSLEKFEQAGIKHQIPRVRHNLGIVANAVGDRELAARYYEESLKDLRELGETAQIAAALTNLGLYYADGGDYEHARAHLEESATRQRALSDACGLASALVGIARVDRLQDSGSIVALLESLTVALQVRDHVLLVSALAEAAAALQVTYPAESFGIARAALRFVQETNLQMDNDTLDLLTSVTVVPSSTGFNVDYATIDEAALVARGLLSGQAHA